MISRRHLVALLVILGVALAPTVPHGYIGRVTQAPKVVEGSLPSAVGGVTGTPKIRTGGWMKDTYGADSWAERTYQPAGQGEVGLFVARGFDMKKLYHHPELGVLRGRSFEPQRIKVLEGDGKEIVHVLRNLSTSESAVYALLYEDRWVGNPYLLQLSSAFSTLWTGQRPITLVFAYGHVLADGEPSPFTTELLRTAVQQLAPASSGRP